MNSFSVGFFGGLLFPVVISLFYRFIIICLYAGRDTIKYKFKHVKKGRSKLWLIVYYPIIFCEEIITQTKAWWGGYSITSGPSNMTEEEYKEYYAAQVKAKEERDGR